MTLEAFLALVWTDGDVLAEFLRDPEGAAIRRGVQPALAADLRNVDAAGVELQARAFAAKREGKRAGRG